MKGGLQILIGKRDLGPRVGKDEESGRKKRTEVGEGEINDYPSSFLRPQRVDFSFVFTLGGMRHEGPSMTWGVGGVR